jgi:UDP-2-acetamido-2,6-beta-L-arabino-hexul-4-ose reductase
LSVEHKKTYALTGSGGFLGWHVKLALHALGHQFIEVPVGDRFDLGDAAAAIGRADELIHLAGVNRGTDDEIAEGNRLFAEQLSQAVAQSGNSLDSITYANSSQSTSDNVYGRAKLAAAEILARTVESCGGAFRDIVLPNLFGEHGRPFYNSVVATFSHLLATGEGEPSIQADRELTLLHAQDAADWLIGSTQESQHVRQATVSELLAKLQVISQTYRNGEFPDLSDEFNRDLFNTYRSYSPTPEIPLHEHKDNRGSFVEVTRSWGGTGQSSFSTTHPGITRGNHYHRRKVERFVVLSGKANLALRRMFTDQVINIVADEEPVAIDQPTGWTHNLTNAGDQTLYMFFWTNDIFDPDNPDTFVERV